jgi:hypothetical protein
MANTSPGWATATPQPVETPSQRNDGMINPRDKIGDFLITTGDGEDVIFVTKLHCPFDNSIHTSYLYNRF